MNQIKQTPAAAIMQREVTRKEFLGALGLGMASILGFSNIIKLMTGKSLDSHFGTEKAEAGYGASTYGQ
jgi:hypothetical protein